MTKKGRTAGSSPGTAAPGNRRFSHAETILLGVLLILTLWVYLPALRHSFTNWDDNDYVTENRFIRDPDGAAIEHIFTQPIALNYHPLTILSLALNHAWSGDEPWSYFLVNILLHLCNVLFTWWLILALFPGRRILALWVAAVFALHPMHVESVAWISERKDVLYLFFFLPALIAWIRHLRTGRYTWYGISLALFVFSGLSKPSAVIFPGVLLLVDYLDKRRWSWRLVWEKIPFFLVSAWIGAATLQAQVGHAVVDIRHYNFIQQMLFASYGFFMYLFRFFVPAGLSAFHPVPVFNTSLELPWIYFAAPLFSLAVIGLAAWSLRHTRVVMFGLLFYLLAIVLTLQFMQVGSAVIAERYTYLAYTGVGIAVGWPLVTRFGTAGSGRMILLAGIFTVSVVMGVLSASRVGVWRDSGTLWRDVAEKYPESYTAHNNLGYFNVQQKRYDEALENFNRSLAVSPGFTEALNNRGSLYRLLERPREALADYNRALGLNPGHVKALTGRGNAYEMLGKYDSALADMNRAYAIDSLAAAALCDRGAVWFKAGRFPEAIEECTRKLEADPSARATRLNRGVAYSSTGQWEKAIADYTVVISQGGENPSVYEWRGVAFRNLGRLPEAIADFTKGLALDPARASLYVNRAGAFRQAGRIREAAADEEVLRKMSPGGGR